VGVARALAADPVVMLMDEPFSAIDPIARDRLQGEFHRLQREVGKTVLFVTHDVAEAVRLGDRIAVLREGGHLEQYDVPAAVLGAPASRFVAEFVGADRGVKRLGVTRIDTGGLGHPPVQTEDGSAAAAGAGPDDGQPWGWRVVVDSAGAPVGWLPADGPGPARPLSSVVASDATLLDALSATLEWDGGWVAVVEPGSGRYLGVLTPAAVHGSLRSSSQ
jgi:osmoprotectant transport system ATP-binding protein